MQFVFNWEFAENNFTESWFKILTISPAYYEIPIFAA